MSTTCRAQYAVFNKCSSDKGKRLKILRIDQAAYWSSPLPHPTSTHIYAQADSGQLQFVEEKFFRQLQVDMFGVRDEEERQGAEKGG